MIICTAQSVLEWDFYALKLIECEENADLREKCRKMSNDQNMFSYTMRFYSFLFLIPSV